MKPAWLLVVFLLALGCCMEASAASVGGGRNPRRLRGGSTNNNKDSTAEDKKKQDEEAHKKHKESMPATETVKDADTSAFDRVSDKLALSRDQTDKIDEAKKRIKDRVEELRHDQDRARSSFENAKEADCPARAQALASVVQLCKAFNADADFNSTLANILTRDQRVKLQEFQARK